MSKRMMLISAIFFVSFLGCETMKIRYEADKALASGDYSTAISKYNMINAENSDDWKLQIRLSYAYILDGKYDKAIQVLEKPMKSMYGKPWAIYYTGFAFIKKGERAKGIELWKQYKNKFRQDVEKIIKAEIKRQETLLQVEEAQNFAKKAVKSEKDLGTIKVIPNSFAVVNYKNMTDTKDLGAFQKGLSAMIITDLSKVKSLKMVERIKVQALLNEIALAKAGVVDEKTAPKAGKLLGAEKILSGTVAEGSISIMSSVADVSSNKNEGTFSVKGEKEDFFKLEKNIVHNIIKILKIRLTSEEEKEIGQYYTTKYKAFIYYGKGLEEFDKMDFDKAKEFFDIAVKEDPNFLLAKMAGDSTPDRESLSIEPNKGTISKALNLGLPKESGSCGN